ncbi:MAG: low molecular weight protein arginine phosphatase [Kiritimatiellae bacterium]|nr:low molecular weight protein arginine phosphatase [Kiritimatiellia bacterium]NLD90030.1 low molecular weight protein arginine phosphatase [Lentisphaerota bacterium]HOU21152.1 low molecular weight protein arginine phosphatase [Kiritimatiellia bacterium]HPC20572.1 low molecular weight protein arginine phosphatase [Kiritimatiellia bacterium]HQN79578.1 low molecular weight protein arginine phosphatase [Kiritimatiellia bacterium]
MAVGGQAKKVLVVCTGNTCRSPMAAGWLNRKLADKGWIAESAGVAAWRGSPASPEAVEAMREIGVDISAHLSRGLTHEMVAGADIVLAATEGHRRELEQRFPDSAGKLFLLDGFGAGPAHDVPDPIGSSMDVYRHVRDVLVRALGDFLLYLAEHNKLN